MPPLRLEFGWNAIITEARENSGYEAMEQVAIHYLQVQITRFSRDDNPGWVACEFLDAENRLHTFEEKVPVVSSEDLDGSSGYPRPGVIACTVMVRWQDSKGRELVRINTD